MSMYADYCKEREGHDVFETDEGFVRYVVNGEECYIIDIYVVKDKRRSHVASQLADYVAERAKRQGATYLTGSVDPRLPTATKSMKVLLGYGMRVHSIREPLIFFIKEL